MKLDKRLRRIDVGIGILLALFVLSFWVIPPFMNLAYGVRYEDMTLFIVIAFISVGFLYVWAMQHKLFKK